MFQKLQSWLTLAATPRLSITHLSRLLQHFPAEKLVEQDADTLRALGLKPQQIQTILSPDKAYIDKCLAWLEKPNCHLISFDDSRYPYLLKQITSAPKILFVEGDPKLLACPQLAIVGSRKASAEGMQAAYDFAYQLALRQVPITSGLALGIDGRAHRAALDAKGKTLAVLGSGLDSIYPKAHFKLAREIADTGALISEFVPWTPPKASFFPKRNRVISGLSVGVLVIEASLKSGSLITARLALEQGRDVFALPQSIYHTSAQGSNALIKQGAFLVDSLDDILQQIDILSECARVHQIPIEPEQVTQEELPFPHLLANVGNEVICVDLLAERCNQPVSDIMMQLLELELQGLISAVPGGYVRTRRNGP